MTIEPASTSFCRVEGPFVRLTARVTRPYCEDGIKRRFTPQNFCYSRIPWAMRCHLETQLES
jgi:hypothetical protein